MSSCSRDAANLLPVNPLFDGGKTDAELQSRIAEFQQPLILPSRFAVLRHRNKILQSTRGTVNMAALWLPSEQKRIYPCHRRHRNDTSYTFLNSSLESLTLEALVRKIALLFTAVIVLLSSTLSSAQEKDPCTSGHEFATTDCALSWHGITLYGAYDVGVGYVSHGLPENGYNYEGASLVNRNGYQHRFLVAPNNLQQTGLGIRAKEEFLPGWSVVFNAATGINPQSGLLANASETDIINNGLPRSSYSYAIDGARAGQPFNDEIYGGISSTHFGTLTFGRQRSLGTDAMLLYDPAGGAYAFSYIGYNGTMAGGGDTEDSRWDDAVKYRIAYGPVHFGAMYKFADGSGGCYDPAAATGATWTATSCTPQSAHNNAYGFDLGGTIGPDKGKFSADVVFQHYNQAISVLNPLLGPQSPATPHLGFTQSLTDSLDTTPINGGDGLGPNLISTDNTVYGIVTDNNAVMFAAKYVRDPFKFFAGYEYIWQNNPADPLGVGASDQGGYIMSGVEDNNLDSEKLVNIWWTGVKYAYDRKTDITFAWYGQSQNTFRIPSTCSIAAGFRSSCAGVLEEGSLYLDHHFTKRFDGFAGLAYSFVTGGLAIAIPHGPGVPYLHNSNFAPVLGGRFSF